MSCWVVIPIRAPDDGKTRLAETLDAAARGNLVRAMLERVVGAASNAGNVDSVCLIGPSRHGLSDRLTLLDDPGTGLNSAASSARDHAAQLGATRIIILFADLPLIAAQDVEQLAATEAIAIAPDRHGIGTNALSLPLPGAKDFAFAFGTGSFALHQAEAKRLGLIAETIRSPGLARDVDVPDDLPDAAGLL